MNMSPDLRDLYQSVILDHHKKPRNFRVMTDANGMAEGFNPLCGDRVDVYVRGEGDAIADVSFQGAGCAICTASASLMTESLKGKSRDEAYSLFHRFHEMLAAPEPPDAVSDLGKLGVFAGVREFPIRVKCATLPWHTFLAALEKKAGKVSTE